MKIIFYEIRDFEFNYLTSRIPNTLEPAFFRHSLNSNTYLNENQKDIDAISIFVSSKLTKEVLEKFKNLKYIFLRCSGYSNIDLDYCREKNIKIFNVPDYGSSTVAEYVFLLLLSLSRKINKTINDLKNGIIDANEIMGIELKDKTLGVIGVGNIGEKIINIAYGFNMNVLAYDINKKDNFNYIELDELLKKSDFVCLSCPLNENTRELINKNTLSLMKSKSFLINVARGEIVNTKDLYMALINKKIAGAALDVIECEENLCKQRQECIEFDNLKNYCLKKYFFINKLKNLENVIITPHNAYNTEEANEKILNITLDNINSIQNSKPNIQNQIILS